MDAVNLLPLEHKARAKKRSAPAGNLDSRKTLRTGGLAALAVVVLVGALYGYERTVVNSKKSALAKDQAALAEIKPKADAIKQAKASAAARLSVISNVSSSRMNWDRALNDFARIVPTDSFLTSLSFDAPVQTSSIVAPVAVTPTTTSSSTDPADTTTPATPTPSGS
jgi:Tfp pilus assembly protein PilN